MADTLAGAALVVACHEQPAGIVILKLPVPPVIGNACVSGEIVNKQALVEVCKLRLQLPAMLPTLSPPVSSTIYNLHVPFGALP